MTIRPQDKFASCRPQRLPARFHVTNVKPGQRCTRMQITAEEWIADLLPKFPMRIFRGKTIIRPLELVPDTGYSS